MKVHMLHTTLQYAELHRACGTPFWLAVSQDFFGKLSWRGCSR